MIREAKLEDAQSVADIYNHYVATTVISFDESPQPVDKFIKSIEDGNPWFILENEGKVAGFTYAVQWKVKNAYRFIYESTIYLSGENTSKGDGSKLYSKLIEECRNRNLHSLVACIALPHEISVKFHEKHGFVKSGHIKEAGFKFGNWVDVGYWQLLL